MEDGQKCYNEAMDYFMGYNKQILPNEIKAFELFSRGATLNHGLCVYWTGKFYYYGWSIKRDKTKGVQLLELAVHKHNIVDAYYELGTEDMMYPEKKHVAAVMLKRLVTSKQALVDEANRLAAHFTLAGMCRREAYAIAPWGKWKPDAIIHSLVPLRIHQQVFTWLLIAKRLHLLKELSYMIIFYINTK